MSRKSTVGSKSDHSSSTNDDDDGNDNESMDENDHPMM
jgi:hypothetical protein